MALAEGCAVLRETGYAGIEIAPFTLAENPLKLSASERRTIRDTIADHRLSFVGLHWILAAPPGLHATTPDKEQRERTWGVIDGLIDLCADLSSAPDEPT
jgi:sugar phosphate isomerase/epimerase